jgi:membrane-associated phospholipid phosphatase
MAGMKVVSQSAIRLLIALTVIFGLHLPAIAQTQLAPASMNTGDSAALPDAPSTTAAAESNSFAAELGRGIVIIGKDELTFIKAPFQKHNLKWDLLFAAATAPLFATDVSVLHQVNPAWHDNSINISNAMVYSTAASAGGIFVVGLVTDNTHAKDTGVAAVRGTIDSAILYGALKLVFARERPYSANGDGSFFSGNFSSGSFPSGHSTLTWTLASVVAHEYPKWQVALLMYSMATAASTTRVTAGVHFPSDVVVGATFGYLIGRYVAKQDNHLPGDAPVHPKSKLIRAEDAVLSHVSFAVQ